jgi:hypothetical protein
MSSRTLSSFPAGAVIGLSRHVLLDRFRCDWTNVRQSTSPLLLFVFADLLGCFFAAFLWARELRSCTEFHYGSVRH